MGMDEARELAEEYEDELLDRDARLLMKLGKAYGQVARGIDGEITKLADKIAAAQESGEALSPSWAFQGGRLSSLKTQVTRALAVYNAIAEPAIGDTKREAVLAGSMEALNLLGAATGMPRGLDPATTFGKLPDRAIEALVERTQDGTPLAKVLGRYSDDIAERMESALVRGLGLGRGPATIARELRDITGNGAYQSLRLARTEVMTAQRGARIGTFRENSEVVEEWEWKTGQDERVCLFCNEMEGTRHPLDEEMESHPNCRCSPLPVTKSWAELLGAGVVEVPEE